MTRDWTLDDEIKLFSIICDHKPAGKLKNEKMVLIINEINNGYEGIPFTPSEVWTKLELLYDLKRLDVLEEWKDGEVRETQEVEESPVEVKDENIPKSPILDIELKSPAGSPVKSASTTPKQPRKKAQVEERIQVEEEGTSDSESNSSESESDEKKDGEEEEEEEEEEEVEEEEEEEEEEEKKKRGRKPLKRTRGAAGLDKGLLVPKRRKASTPPSKLLPKRRTRSEAHHVVPELELPLLESIEPVKSGLVEAEVVETLKKPKKKAAKPALPVRRSTRKK